METCKKRADRIQTHAALEAKRIERGNDEARQPLPPLVRFPEPGLRMAVATFHRVLEAMDTALRQPSLLGNAAHALPAVVTKALENQTTFVPKSHVGLCSEG